MPRIIKVFTAGHCEPCHEVAKLLKEGKFEVDIDDADVDLIDIETEEGFAQVDENNLAGVPAARFQGKECKISIDRDLGILVISCALKVDNPPQLDAHMDNSIPKT